MHLGGSTPPPEAETPADKFNPYAPLITSSLADASTLFARGTTPEAAAKFKEELDALHRRHVLGQNDAPPPPKRCNVFMAMPRYGPVERESDLAAMTCAFHTDGMNVRISDRMTSATPNAFNQSWCDCMNELAEFDYFVMLHSDLAPQGQWVSTLIKQLEENNLDVIHAAACIKDNRGLLSTAVGSNKGPWTKFRRVTLTELHQLPKCFTADDYFDLVGKEGFKDPSDLCMFNNTGAMCVKLDPTWRRFHGFRFQDRLCATKDGKTFVQVDDSSWDGEGRIFNQFWPEDWDMGQWCSRNGKKVGCSWEVVTLHFGRAAFVNSVAMGDKSDAHFHTDWLE